MQISDDQQSQITAFIGNKEMTDAVLAILLPTEEDLAADVSLELDDAEYGRAVKVWRQARHLIHERFAELQRLASRNPQPPPQNGAR